MKRKLLLTVGLFLGPALLLAGSALAAPGITQRVSLSSAGLEGNDPSYEAAISANGRYVAFRSFASNLVWGDTNNFCDINGDTLYDENCSDVFVRDLQTAKTTLVSVDSEGNQANGESWVGALTPDGRYVAFDSTASNLVPDDINGYRDVFVHDRETGETTLVSVDSAGVQGNQISHRPVISADGRYVAFISRANNLVPDDTNWEQEVFVHDRQTGETKRASVDSAGNQGNEYSRSPAISADGRYVAFFSYASNLVPDDTNWYRDVFVHDLQTGQTTRVSVDSAGNEANGDSYGPDISADGRYVAFDSTASNLVPGDTNGCYDIFVHDRQTGDTTRVSVDSAGNEGNGSSWYYPAISADGYHVAFRSSASNLVPDDSNGVWDIFVHDRQTGETTRVSVDSAGNQANAESWVTDISGDGRYVAFDSYATNLVWADTNQANDVFVHDRWPAAPTPTATPTSMPTPTPTATPSPTPILTPTPTPTPAPDSDGDGCADPEELAMGFDPLACYDFYDVPVPANPAPTPNGARDQAVAMDDVLAVLFYVGTYDGDGGSPNANGVAYDVDKDTDTVADGRDYDRSPSAEPNPPWDAGPPSGAVAMDDVLVVLAQVGLSCIDPP